MSPAYYSELKRNLEAARPWFTPTLGETLYHIFEAEAVNKPGEWLLVGVDAHHESKLREDIDLGRVLLKLGRLIYATPDKAKANRLADRRFF